MIVNCVKLRMVAIAASSYSIEMGDKERARLVLEDAVELLGEGPLVRIAADASRVEARTAARDDESTRRELVRLAPLLAAVDCALEELLAGLESGTIELYRRHIDLAAVVVAAIVQVPDRERISYARSERAMVVVDPQRACIACGVLLNAAVQGCAGDKRVEVRTTQSGHVEVVSQGAVRMDMAAFALHVAARIARAHGGDASMETTHGMTRWNLWLPTVRRRRVDARILLIDDNVEQSQALAALLRLEGLTVDVSSSAADALGYLACRRPDLLLVDMRLGEVGGDELIRLARGQYPGLPAIVITGYPREHAKVRAILSEAPSDYIAKPTDPDALFELVARMISA